MEKYIQKKVDFLKDYVKAETAADGSAVDANANIAAKNVATMSGELWKSDTKKLNRALMQKRITELYGEKEADKYLNLIKENTIYVHDESSILPYCMSVSLFPYLAEGTKSLGGNTSAPKNIKAFCGGYCNLIFILAAQCAGAVATPSFLLVLDYFARKEYGEDYYMRLDEQWTPNRTIRRDIETYLEQVVYTINAPAGSRTFQSPFTNWSVFDKYYFESMYGGFRFPDGTTMNWESSNVLQKLFLEWFNDERRKALLTFPVMTAALLTDGEGDYKDKEWADYYAQHLADGGSIFLYSSPVADSLSSCCRLRNEVDPFTTSIGGASEGTGSSNVITINLNRFAQDVINGKYETKDLKHELKLMTQQILRFQKAHRSILKDWQKAGLLPVYDTGYVTLEKLYITVGIIGVVEMMEFLGYEISDNEEYLNAVGGYLKVISDECKAIKTKEIMANVEQVPGENLAGRLSALDKADGYKVNRDVYSGYLFAPENESLDVYAKVHMHGDIVASKMLGGNACHINLKEHLTQAQYRMMMKEASVYGTNYIGTNIPYTECSDCGYISKHNLDHCEKCGSKNVDYITRVVGFLVRHKSMHKIRNEEFNTRHFGKKL